MKIKGSHKEEMTAFILSTSYTPTGINLDGPILSIICFSVVHLLLNY